MDRLTIPRVGAPETQADRLAAVAALGEPLRRRIYLFVASEPDMVSRDQAAARFDVSRAVAAFHLDKLADLGLLDVEFRRPPGRGGPGAGRPAKLYRSVKEEVAFSLPPREYELAGRLLAEALTVSQRDGIPVEEALSGTARGLGQSLGRRALDNAGDASEPTQLVEAVCDVLNECAYEPRLDGQDVVLVNCPFHSLAQEYRALVCGMNLALVSGLTDEVDGARLAAHLDPGTGHCCVRLTARGGAGQDG